MRRVLYEVVLRGRVGGAVTQALDGFDLVAADVDETVLRGWVTDQAALHGALDRIAAFDVEIKRLTALEVST